MSGTAGLPSVCGLTESPWRRIAADAAKAQREAAPKGLLPLGGPYPSVPQQTPTYMQGLLRLSPCVSCVKMNNYITQTRSRIYVCLLYSDDQSHAFALEQLTNGSYASVGILHDKDVCVDANTGEVIYDESTGQPALKKAHYHFVVRFKNAKYALSLAKELSIAPNYLRPSVDFRAACRYLCHLDTPEKHQYSVNELIGPLAHQALGEMTAQPEDDQAMRILEIIRHSGYLTHEELTYICIHEHLWATLRRGGSWFMAIMREHNNSIRRRKK